MINLLFTIIYLSFSIKCLEIFNQEIYLLPNMISTLKNYFKNYKINSFNHLKQLLTEEISLESEYLNVTNQNPTIDKKRVTNFISQAETYNEIIDSYMDEDNFEAIIIYLFNLEGFIFNRLNSSLNQNSLETTKLKLFFILLQASISRQGQDKIYKFMKINNLIIEDEISNKKSFKLYKCCNLENLEVQKFLNLFKITKKEESINRKIIIILI